MAVHDHAPVYVISVAAELAEMHPQTLRQYDRLGLVSPSRAPGRSRRYSQHDVDLLREIQVLSQAGVSLEGIKRIMELENQVAALQAKVKELSEQLSNRDDQTRVFAASLAGEVVGLSSRKRAQVGSQAVMVWRPHMHKD